MLALLEAGFPLLKGLGLVEKGVFTRFDKGFAFAQESDLFGQRRMGDLFEGFWSGRFGGFRMFLIPGFQVLNPGPQAGDCLVLSGEVAIGEFKGLPGIAEVFLEEEGVPVDGDILEKGLAVIKETFTGREEDLCLVDHPFALGEFGAGLGEMGFLFMKLNFGFLEGSEPFLFPKINQIARLGPGVAGPLDDRIDGKTGTVPVFPT